MSWPAIQQCSIEDTSDVSEDELHVTVEIWLKGAIQLDPLCAHILAASNQALANAYPRRV